MKRSIWPLSLAFILLIGGAVWLGVVLHFRAQPAPPLTQPAWGKALPHFSLPDLDDPTQRISPEDLHGAVYLLNYWASWCISCKREHEFLLHLAHSKRVKLYSVNYQDSLEAARATLAHSGNPYVRTIFDPQGVTGRSYGIVGTPITFVVDKHGKLRYKHLGPLNAEIFAHTIAPLIDALEAN
jgi:cytochrome c biogenesis protein CcmG, thiol:disulfide interchange protein DsbE